MNETLCLPVQMPILVLTIKRTLTSWSTAASTESKFYLGTKEALRQTLAEYYARHAEEFKFSRTQNHKMVASLLEESLFEGSGSSRETSHKITDGRDTIWFFLTRAELFSPLPNPFLK